MTPPSDMNHLTYHIETWGCQMNVHDSEQLADSLERSGYKPADSPEDASVIVLNTCSVRDKAAQKVFTRLGRLSSLKRHGGPGLGPSAPLLCVAGCVAQQEGEEIIQRIPAVDLVLGTRRTTEIGALLGRVWQGDGPMVSTDLDGDIQQKSADPIHRRSPWKAYVTIIEGCDNFCAYCIVPLVRGREKSRRAEAIIEEVTSLVGSGVREIELLGQNVNSFDDGECRFTDLLTRVAEVPGLDRLRFTVSHPRDFTPELARLMASKSEIICRHLHLPLQAGSNRVLKAMGRGYTREAYLEKIADLRSQVPEIAISTDLIVGYPGETEDDFLQTLDVIRTVRYDATFSFMYNPRPGTRAARLTDDVSDVDKRSRLSRLLVLQKSIQLELHEALVGQELDVLTEGESRQGNGQYFGRDSGNRVVNFDSPDFDPTGRMVRVKISRPHPNSLFGTVIDIEDMP